MKDKLFEKAITWAERKGFKGIKANCDDFETPSGLTHVSENRVLIPDITGMLNGSKSYIEIALKGEDDRQATISKWKLFSLVSKNKGGKLFLLAGRGHKAFAEQIVKDYDLMNASVISI